MNSTNLTFLPLTEPAVVSTAYRVFLLLVSTPLITLTIIGNSLIILSWIFQKSVRTPPNAYFVSLAVTDLIVGVFIFPLIVSYSYHKRWIYGLTLCKPWLVLYYSLCAISAYHLVAIGADRYRAITEGVTYLQRRSMKSTVEKIIIIWLAGLWVSLPPILDWNNIALDPTGVRHCITRKIPFWVVHVTCTCMAFPGYFIIRIYANVFLEIKKRLAARRGNPMASNTPSCLTDDEAKTLVKDLADVKAKQTLDKEKKAAQTLGLIIGAFLLCWVPWYLVAVVDMTVPADSIFKPAPYLQMWTSIAGLANSCINPIIYAYRIPEFKTALSKICFFCRKK